MIKYSSNPQKIKTKMMFLIILQKGIKHKYTRFFLTKVWCNYLWNKFASNKYLVEISWQD